MTCESTVEFVASAVAPSLYRLASRSTRFEIATLAAFCMRVYTISHGCALAVALIFAPCILGGANGPNGREVDDCDATNCGCVNASAASCPLVWVNGSGDTRACCLYGSSSRDYCELLDGETSACPLSQSSERRRIRPLVAYATRVPRCRIAPSDGGVLERLQRRWWAQLTAKRTPCPS